MRLALLMPVGLLAAGTVWALSELQTASPPIRPVPSARLSEPLAMPADAASVVASKSVTFRDFADRLIRGRDWLRTVPDYTAVFFKQERVGDELRPLETIDLKVRHAPFSVAMTWRDVGRIVYFQEAANDNRISVRLGGWKRRLGWIYLDPNSSLAMQEARYPITDVGLLRLTEQLLERLEPYLDVPSGVTCVQQADEEIDGRRCGVFVMEYASAVVNPDYRRSLVWLDAEWLVPLAVQNYDWSTDNPANPEGLMEYYVYENVRLNRELTDADFSAEGRTASDVETASVKP